METEMETDIKTDMKKNLIATCNALASVLSSLEHVLDRLELLTLQCFRAATDPEAARHR
jgi:hypothetical protein